MDDDYVDEKTAATFNVLQLILDFLAKQHWATLAASIDPRHDSRSILAFFINSKYHTMEGYL